MRWLDMLLCLGMTYPSSLSDTEWDHLRCYLPPKTVEGRAATRCALSSTRSSTCFGGDARGATSRVTSLGRRSTTTSALSPERYVAPHPRFTPDRGAAARGQGIPSRQRRS